MTYKPYTKENSSIKYVNVQSNYPAIIIKNIPKGINTRLSQISSSSELFHKHSEIYRKELDDAGHKHICWISQDLSAADSLHQQSSTSNFINVYKFFDRVCKVSILKFWINTNRQEEEGGVEIQWVK